MGDKMIIVKNENNNPFFNHAAEEFLMDNFNEECFMLWINRPSILIGRNQNALAEINMEFVKEKDITVVRRPSGGGTVFNDYGNMNFTFISNADENGFGDFKKFAFPVIDALKKLSVEAEFSGRNDITIEGKKISGNAQYKNKDRVLHHGTLLFSASMNNLAAALNVRPIKLKGKGVTSVASRVTNISEYLKEPMSLAEFKEFLTNYMIENCEGSRFYEFSSQDIASINKIVDSKYAAWEWNFGKTPEFTIKNERKYEGGILEVNLNVDKGYIKDIKLYGDFFGKRDISILERSLISVKHEENALNKVLEDQDITSYMNNISKENLIQCILGY